MKYRQFCVHAEGGFFLSPWMKSAVLLLLLERIVPYGDSGQCMSVLEVWLGSPIIPNCIFVCGIT